MDGAIIKLSKPVTAFGETFTELTLREPTGALYARLGEPRIGVSSGDSGGGYFVEQPATINAYLDALLTGISGEAKAAVLPQITLVDSMKLKRALFSFFEVAAATAAAKP